MQNASRLPVWLQTLAQASTDFSLKCDEREVPRDLRDAIDWSRPKNGPAYDMFGRLKSCTPREAHYFLHWAYCESITYDCLTPLFDVVLRRPDCDRATALNYFAYYWSHYSEGRNEWIGDEQHALMSYIRVRAWGMGFRQRRLDVAEHVLHEHDRIRDCLVLDPQHPFAMPDSFVALSKKEDLYFKIRGRLLPRKAYVN